MSVYPLTITQLHAAPPISAYYVLGAFSDFVFPGARSSKIDVASVSFVHARYLSVFSFVLFVPLQ